MELPEKLPSEYRTAARAFRLLAEGARMYDMPLDHDSVHVYAEAMASLVLAMEYAGRGEISVEEIDASAVQFESMAENMERRN